MGMEFRFTNNSDKVLSEMREKVEMALDLVGGHVADEAGDELENPPRRVDTGRLKNSITHEVDGKENAVYVGTNVEYAIYVHEGTRRMTPNRFLKNACVRNEAQIRKFFEDKLK